MSNKCAPPDKEKNHLLPVDVRSLSDDDLYEKFRENCDDRNYSAQAYAIAEEYGRRKGWDKTNE